MGEGGKKIDMDFCLILFDRLEAPSLTEDQTMIILKDLIDAVTGHEELQTMLMAGITDIAKLKENFKDKVMEINGETPVEDNTDYVELVRKLIDPNISDQDVKPLLIQLNTGTLDADQTHLAHIIINCKDASQRKIYLEDFRKSFKKKSWEMDQKEKEEAKKKKEGKKKRRRKRQRTFTRRL